MTDRYAVFGHPIAHSKSPLIHAAFAHQTGQDMTYEAILAPKDGFADAVPQSMRGGARAGRARGVIGPPLDQPPAALVIATRPVRRAQELAELFGHGASACGFDAL